MRHNAEMILSSIDKSHLVRAPRRHVQLCGQKSHSIKMILTARCLFIEDVGLV